MSCSHGGCGCGKNAGPPSPGRCGVGLCAAAPAVVRLTLGGLLIMAGVMKLGDLRGAFDAVNAFHLGLGDGATVILSRVVPFAEILAGTLLVLGLWARGAAVVVAVMMLGFIAGIASVMLRGMDVKCGCFGSLKLFCGDRPMGWCHIIRNSVMAAGAALIVVRGAGMLALDKPTRGSGGCRTCGSPANGLPQGATCPECGRRR